MRISDWSSDVCSSDLGGPADRRAHVERVEPAQLLEVLLDEIGELQQQGLALERLHPAPRALEGAAGRCYGAVYVLGVALGAIGRASCRERGSPFGLNSEVAESLIEQKQKRRIH